jgi:hypothetical protein
MVSDNRKKLARELNIPDEDASRILIEKQKAIAHSEVRFHVKSMCVLLDRIRKNDPEFADAVSRETVKFILARHGNSDALDEVMGYIENLSDNFMDRLITDSFRDE